MLTTLIITVTLLTVIFTVVKAKKSTNESQEKISDRSQILGKDAKAPTESTAEPESRIEKTEQIKASTIDKNKPSATKETTVKDNSLKSNNDSHTQASPQDEIKNITSDGKMNMDVSVNDSTTNEKQIDTPVIPSAPVRLVNIVKNIAFAANTRQDDLQFIELITKQCLDFCDTNKDDDAFLHEMLTLLPRAVYYKYEIANNAYCLLTIEKVVRWMIQGKSDKEIINLFIEFENRSRYDSSSVTPDKILKQNKNTSATQSRNIQKESENRKDKGQLIASLSHKDRAFHYANVIVQELLQQYKLTGDNTTTFKDFMVRECKQRIHGNLHLVEEKIETETPTYISTNKNQKSYIQARALTPKVSDPDNEIQEVIDIADRLTSMRLHHNEPYTPTDICNSREYKNKSSWDVFEDFVIKEYDNRKDPRFSILYQMLIKAVELTQEGKSKEDIINYLKDLNIERVDSIPRKSSTKTIDKKEYKSDKPVVYTADALRLLNILKEISKRTHSNHLLKLGNDLIDKYFNVHSEKDLYPWASNYLDENQVVNQTFEKQCLKQCCDLLMEGKNDPFIIREVSQKYTSVKAIRDTAIKERPVTDNSVKSNISHHTEAKELIVKNQKIIKLFETCKDISNNMFATPAEKKSFGILQDSYNRYYDSSRKLSFLSFLKLEQGCDSKHKEEYKLIISEFEKILKKDQESNIFQNYMGPTAPLKRSLENHKTGKIPSGLHIRKSDNGLWGCTLNNTCILKPQYQSITLAGENNNYLIVKGGKLYGIFFIQGGKAHPYLPIKYTSITKLYQNNYLVHEQKNYGIVKLGSESIFVAEPIYTSIEHDPYNVRIITLKRKGKHRRLILK